MNKRFDDRSVFRRIQQSDENAFRELYEYYWDRLLAFTYNRLYDLEASEEIVQKTFIYLWEKRADIDIKTSLSSWLFGAARHHVLNVMRSGKVRRAYAEDFRKFASKHVDNSNEEYQNVAEIKRLIEESLAGLPPKCQRVYRMSRQQHISNKDIAKQLNISKKTVENYLTMALKHLKGRLGPFMKMIVLILMG